MSKNKCIKLIPATLFITYKVHVYKSNYNAFQHNYTQSIRPQNFRSNTQIEIICERCYS